MYKAKVTFDAAGVPSVTAPVKQDFVAAALGTVTGVLSTDEIQIPEGIVDNLMRAGIPAALGAVVQKKMLTDQIGLPFTK